MKKVWLTSIILSGAMAAGLYAQQSTTAPSSTSDKVTVQGCVERAGSQASTAGTTGTTGSTATGSTAEAGSTMAGAQFVLTNVSNSNTPSTTAGTTGTTGSTATPSSSEPAASQYRLDDSGQNRLASYVGQKVEVSGTVQSHEAGASSTAGSTASATTASGSQSASSNESSPKLKVDSIRMIASSCSGL